MHTKIGINNHLHIWTKLQIQSNSFFDLIIEISKFEIKIVYFALFVYMFELAHSFYQIL